MASNTHYLWAGLKAGAKARVQKTGSSLKALFDRLRYGKNDPEVWKANWLKFKDGLKGQTPLVEEKSPKREQVREYLGRVSD